VRLAGSDEVFNSLSATARNTKHDSGQHVESVIEQIELLRAKGLGEQAAITHGLNIWEGKEEAVSAGPRFAAIYGDVPTSPPGDDSPGNSSD